MKGRIQEIKLTRNAKILLVCAAVIVTAFALIASSSDMLSAGDRTTGGSILYYTNGATPADGSGSVDYVEIDTYYGIKSAEYNPEYWNGWGEVGANVNWVGPSGYVQWVDAGQSDLTVTLTFNITPRDGNPHRITIPETDGVTTAIQSISPSGTKIDDRTFEVTAIGTYDVVVKYQSVSASGIPVTKVFAGWKERTYAITFDSGDHSSSANYAINTIRMYDSLELPECSFVPEGGYVFAGWKIGDDVFSPGYVLKNISGPVTVTATWTDSSAYTVTFSGDGAAYGYLSSVSSATSSYVLPDNVYRKTNYAFAGWQVGGSTKMPGDTVVLSSGNTDVTAVWVAESSSTYSVEISSGNVLTNDTNKVSLKYGLTGSVSSFTMPNASVLSGSTIYGAKEFRIWSVSIGGEPYTMMYPGETLTLKDGDLQKGIKITALWRDSVIYPGEVVDWSVTELEAQWEFPYLFISKTINIKNNDWNSSNPRVLSETGRLDMFKINGYRLIDKYGATYNNKAYNSEFILDESNYYTNKTGGEQSDDIFRVINCFMNYGENWSDNNSKCYTIKETANLTSGTYRTVDPIGKTMAGADRKATLSISGRVNIAGNIIIDNVNIVSGSAGGKHGDGSNGLCANNHILIMGTALTNPYYENTSSLPDASSGKTLLQVFGGGDSPNTKIDSRMMVSGRDDFSMDERVDVGTFVMIHSGIYYNVMGGGVNSAVVGTSGSTYLSTYLVFKGGIVTDTVAGGGGSSNSGTVGIHGDVYGASDANIEKYGIAAGGTFLYALKLFTLGDYWEDHESGYDTYSNGNLRQCINTQESSVVEGGGSKGKVVGSTHIFVSEHASLWDVQAGGRNYQTRANYSYLEITGESEIRRVACGTITDGNEKGNCTTVDHANIYVGGRAKVASVYGAGFDTWAYPKFQSMMTGTIDVTIAGGTVHDVFGGGYRGSVGVKGSPNELTINVTVTGGNVEGNVYGGGSGGLNKIKHDYSQGGGKAFQADNSGGTSGSTGRSYVYGNVNVVVSGGTIGGNVYGGGMSVPVLSTYPTVYTDKNSSTVYSYNQSERESNNSSELCQVATVEGNVSVNISGDATVNGSVYGAGRGIIFDSSGNIDRSKYGYNVVLRSNGEFMDMLWTKDGKNSSGEIQYTYTQAYSSTNPSGINYSNYAQVIGNVTVVVEGKDWRAGGNPVTRTEYTVSDADADAGKNIVLRAYADYVDDGTYTVFLVNSSDITTLNGKSAGDTITLEALPSGQTWKVNNVAVTGPYTVASSDAKAGSIVIRACSESGSISDYNIIKIDGDYVELITGRSVGDSVSVPTVNVSNSVYGGSGYGKVNYNPTTLKGGDTVVKIDSAIIGMNVFGGGEGMIGSQSTESNRTVFITGNTRISGSVYGGSQNGYDGVMEDGPYSKVSTVVVQQGTIEGSVFGGGLMGATYSDTAVYIGYYLPSLLVRTPVVNNYSQMSDTVITVNDVFAGGNVSTSSDGDQSDTSIADAYTSDLVMGDGSISVYGSGQRSIDIKGSVMGSGNACNTKGTTTVELVNLYNVSMMKGLHRITTLTLDNTMLKLTGRSPVTKGFYDQDRSLTVFAVDEFILKNKSSVFLTAPMDNIGEFRSLTKEGEPTVAESPINRLVFSEGSTVYVRSINSQTNLLTYNNVVGYTLMTLTDQQSYGAYVLGSANADGGFSTNVGTTTSAIDPMISGDIACWSLSGIQKKIITMNLELGKVENYNTDPQMAYAISSFSITKFQTDTSIIFTGGMFTNLSNDSQGNPFTFVRPGSDTIEDNRSQLGLAIGFKRDGDNLRKVLYDPTERLMDTGNGSGSIVQAGTFYLKNGKENDMDEYMNRSLTSVPMGYTNSSGETTGDFMINLSLSGMPYDKTYYVGYLTLNFQELKVVSYEAVNDSGAIISTPKNIVANTTEVRIDVYIYGSNASSVEEDNAFEVEIKTSPDKDDNRSGSASTLIPQEYTMSSVVLEDITFVGPGSGSMSDISIKEGSKYILPESGYIPPEGKTFDCWKIIYGDGGSDFFLADPGDNIKIIAGSIYRNDVLASGSYTLLKIEPKWIKSANISFDPNGGSGSKSSILVGCGIEYMLPDCSFTPPSGQYFLKWSVKIGDNNSVEMKEGDVIAVTGDVILQALWSDRISVTFNAGDAGASGFMSGYVAKGNRYELPDNGFTAPEGKMFKCWSVSVDVGVAQEMQPGNTVKPKTSLTVTAEWATGTTFTVSFLPGEASGTMDTVTVLSGSKYTLPEESFTDPTTPDQKTFYKWSVKIAGTVNEYDPGDRIVVTSNVTVTALWKITKQVTSTGGSIEGYTITGSDIDISVAYGSEVVIPDCPYTISGSPDRIFEKWQHITVSGTTYYYPGEVVAVFDSIDLTPVWAVKTSTKYTLMFEPGDGSGGMHLDKRYAGSAYVIPNCEFTAPWVDPSDHTLGKKLFQSWSVSIGGAASVTKYPGDTIPSLSSDVVLVANWADPNNTTDIAITFTNIGGTESHIMKIPSGSKYILQSNCELSAEYQITAPTGQSFSHWEVSSTEKPLGSQISSATTLVAIFGTSLPSMVFDSGIVSMSGTITVSAEANQDGTSGWSNVGGSVVWTIGVTNAENFAGKGYVGTLIGNYIGNVTFAMDHIHFVDNDNETFVPKMDLKFIRAETGYEAHTQLVIVDKKYYDVTFVDHGLETVKSFEEDERLTREKCETPTRSNFSGWYLDAEFVNRYDYNMLINDETDGMTLYARYTYVVSLVNGNGTGYELHVNQEDGGALLTQEDFPVPTYDGYDFKGWYKDPDFIYGWGYQSDRVTEDITLYAKWEGKEIRVYFWYKDAGNNYVLFTGTETTSTPATPLADGYDLSTAYQINPDRGLYPTNKYGSKIDTVDSFHEGNMNIMDYARDYLSNKELLTGTFVKWQVVSPSDPTKHIDINKSTTMNTKVIHLVSDDDLKNVPGKSIWSYYRSQDTLPISATYARGSYPETLEIHLIAETTNVAIMVSMEMQLDEIQYSSSVDIEDPQFLVYPNGPDPTITTTKNGETYFVGEFGYFTAVYTNESIANSSDPLEVAYYVNEDGTTRYYWDETNKCWYCVDVSEDYGYHKVTWTKNTDNRSGYGYINEYGVIYFTDNVNKQWGPKGIAYKMEGGVEKKYLVEWKAVGGKVVVKARCPVDSTDPTGYAFGTYDSSDMGDTEKGRGYYLKDLNGVKYQVTWYAGALNKSGEISGVQDCGREEQWNMVDLVPIEDGGYYYEFCYKLNKAVRNGYTLLGWHNDYVSIDNSMTPSPNVVRTVHIKLDGNHVDTATLITKDSSGLPMQTSLMVGNYIVQTKDADADGNIIISDTGSTLTQETIGTATVKVYRYDDAYPTAYVSPEIVDGSITLPTPSKAGYVLDGWQIEDRVLSANVTEYTLDITDSNVKGEIIVCAIWKDMGSFTIKVGSGSNRSSYTTVSGGPFAAGTYVELSGYLSSVDKYGWKTNRVLLDGTSYKVSAKDADPSGIIYIEAIPVPEITSSPEKYVIEFLTDYGTSPACIKNPSANTDLTAPTDLKSEHSSKYEFAGWMVTSGDSRVIRNGVYALDSADANEDGFIVLQAVWKNKYTVQIYTGGSQTSSKVYTEGQAVDLDYTASATWYVGHCDDYVKGNDIKLTSGDPLTLTYRAKWGPIDYYVNVTQPTNGHIDLSLKAGDGSGTYTLLDAERLQQPFKYGDQILLVYTPDDNAAFIKWMVNSQGKSKVNNPFDPTQILIINSDCSISVDESTALTVDIMIDFDAGNLNSADMEYTEVVVHEVGTDNYVSTTYMPGMKGMEHYTAKIPYSSNNYEVCIRYGWTVPVDGSAPRYLEGYESGPDEYALVGKFKITPTTDPSLVFDVISAGFVDSIDTRIDKADTNYKEFEGWMVWGTTPITERSDQTHNFPTSDAYAAGSGNDYIVLVADWENTTLPSEGYKVVFASEFGYVQNMVVKAAPGGSVTVDKPDDPIASGKTFSEWKIWGTESVSWVDGKSTISTVKAHNGYIVLVADWGSGNTAGDYKAVFATSLGYTPNMGVYSAAGSTVAVTMPKDPMSLEFVDVEYANSIFDEKKHELSGMIRTNIADSSSTTAAYRFGATAGTGAGYPTVIFKKVGDEYVEVAKVTKYVGILLSGPEGLNYLKSIHQHINKENGGTPPVELKFAANENYSALEGFPWTVNKGNSYEYVFALESDLNFTYETDSNYKSTMKFWLNWDRTDSPADIIVDMNEYHEPTTYVNMVINKDGNRISVEGLKYDLTINGVEDGFYIVDYPLETFDGYDVALTVSDALQSGEAVTIDGNELHIKLLATRDPAVTTLTVTIDHTKQNVYYTLNNNTIGGRSITVYDPTTSSTVPGNLSHSWGTVIDLPKVMSGTIGGEPFSEEIDHWVIQRPSDNREYTIEKDANGDFKYTLTLDDAKDSSNEDGKRILITPLQSSGRIDITFITAIDSFDDGTKRKTFNVSAGGTIAEYGTSSGFTIITDFISKVFEGEYSFEGFWCGTIKFDTTDPLYMNTVLDAGKSEYIFVADWDPEPSTPFTYHVDGNAHGTVTAELDASESAPFEKDVTKLVMKESEITITIHPDSTYTLDVERTKGELGYSLIDEGELSDVTLKNLDGVDRFIGWQLWGKGAKYLIQDPSNLPTITLSHDDSKNGYMVMVANLGLTQDKKDYAVVFASQYGYVLSGGGSLVNLDYYNQGEDVSLPTLSAVGKSFSGWKLWGTKAVTSAYEVDSDDAVDDFIILVADWGEAFPECTLVYASEMGTPPSAEEDHHYYVDSNGSRFVKNNITQVKRDESGTPVDYKVTEIIGKDGSFVTMFTTPMYSYGIDPKGTCYLNSYTVKAATGTGFTKSLWSGDVCVYDIDGTTVYDHITGSVVTVSFWSTKACTGSAIDLSSISTDAEIYNTVTVYKMDREGNYYHNQYVVGEPSSVSYVKSIRIGAVILFDVDSDNNVYDHETGSKVSVTFFNMDGTVPASLKDLSNGTGLYSKTFSKCELGTLFYVMDGSVKKPYNSEYECTLTSYNYYDGSAYSSNKFRDIFGNIWVQEENDEFKIYSIVIYMYDEHCVETKHTISFDGNEEVSLIDGVAPSPETDYNTWTYYFKDVYGNLVKGNGLHNNKLQYLYYDYDDDGVNDKFDVAYTETNDYIKTLTRDGSSSPVYYMKKNGTLMDSLGNEMADAKLYLDQGGTQPYQSDYSIYMVTHKYNTLASFKENGVTYYKDTYGNTYEDWLGTPTSALGGAGYIWTFFLKDDLDITIYTKEVSYSINFIINGKKVTPNDINKVSTITSTSIGSKEYWGTDIPQYTIVAFDGPDRERDIVWYTDPGYTTEYNERTMIIDPANFDVVVELPGKPYGSAVSDKNFSDYWYVWGGGTFEPETEQNITSGWYVPDSTAKTRYIVLEAKWAENTWTSGDYKVVFATKYGDVPNMIVVTPDSDGSITFTLPEDLTYGGKEFRGWKLWNSGEAQKSSGSATMTITDVASKAHNGYVVLVADWTQNLSENRQSEDLTYTNIVIYTSEFGTVENMELVRKYQFYATQNISLYGHTGTYVVNLYDYSGEKAIIKTLQSDDNGQVTIPTEHFEYKDYLFVGWALLDSEGKRVYTYVPGETINTTKFVKGHLNLYPYYLSDGTMVKYYDGQTQKLELGLNDDLSKQANPMVGDASILNVKYSSEPLSEDDWNNPSLPSTSDIDTSAVGSYKIYYSAKLLTPKGSGTTEAERTACGNTSDGYVFTGKATLDILKIDAYLIAPSVYVKEGQGKIVIVSNPSDASVESTEPAYIIIDREDITVLGLLVDDIVKDGDVPRLDLTYDGSTVIDGSTKRILENAGQPVQVKVKVELRSGTEGNYNLHIIDGSAVVYSNKASEHENEGF